MELYDRAAFTGDTAAARVIADLSARKWRRARDTAKDLAKNDAARYTVLVTAANAGLAHELLSRGLEADAAPVLQTLERSAPPEVLAWVRGGAQSAPPPPAAAPLAVRGFTAESWPMIARLAGELAAGQPGAPEAWRMADLLAPATKAPPAPPEAGAVAGEWHALRGAMDAAGAARWEEMLAALRVLPRASVFQHWRLLLRGIRAVHTGEHAAAAQCFTALPAGSAPARAAAPWQDWLRGPAAPREADDVLAAFCQMPPAALHAARAADAALGKGRRREAWRTLRSALGTAFPTPLPGLAGEWSALVLNARPPRENELKEFDAFVDVVQSDNDARRFKTNTELFAGLRFFLNAATEYLRHDDLEIYWGELLALANRLWGPQPLRDAAAWLHLARHYAAVEASPLSMIFLSRQQGQVHDAPRARKAFERALQCDPHHEAAALEFVAFLESAGDTSARNHLLDDLVERAPHNKEALVKAGVLAVERKSFNKGLTMLRHARTLDPLDANLAATIVAALVSAARDRSKKRPGQSQDDLWEEAESLAVDRCDRSDPATRPGLLRERWALRLQRSLLDAARAPSAAPEAAALAPSSLAHLVLEASLTAIYFNAPAGPWQDRAKPVTAAAAWSDLLESLHAWLHAQSIPGCKPHSCRPAFDLILKAAQSPRLDSADLTGLRNFLTFRSKLDFFPNAYWLGELFLTLSRHLEKAATARNAPPGLVLAWLRLNGGNHRQAIPLARRALAAAKQSGDTALIREAEGLVQEFAGGARGPAGGPFEDAGDDFPDADALLDSILKSFVPPPPGGKKSRLPKGPTLPDLF